ncbi:hypothetical protein JCM17380_15320 [Desulfosporosinus burensis]
MIKYDSMLRAISIAKRYNLENARRQTFIDKKVKLSREHDELNDVDTRFTEYRKMSNSNDMIWIRTLANSPNMGI